MECQCNLISEKNHQNLLFDDENIIKIRCLKCRKPSNSAMGNGHTNGYLNGHIHGHLNAEYSRLSQDADDHIETSEDSPLITDCFQDSEKNSSFHCHEVCVSRNDSKALVKLVWASGFCFLFMLAELVGGYLANSLAIMTDAAHLFSDFVGFMISVLAIWLARKPRTNRMTFGYQRAEVLGAFLSVITIWLLALLFSYLAIVRLYQKDYDIDADTMMIVAALGLLVNIIMGGILHGMCHTHNHGHSHGLSPESSENINVRAAAVHVLGDLLQSVGVLIAAFIIKFVPNSEAADPICTIIFSSFAILITTKVCRDSMLILMEASPVNRDQIMLELRKMPNVRHVHDLQIWCLAPEKNAVSVHLGVESSCDRDQIVEDATLLIKSQISIVSCTVQVESFNMDSISNCLECTIREC